MNEYNIKWSEEDGEYVATCTDYPSLSYLESNPMDALEGLICTILGIIGEENEG